MRCYLITDISDEDNTMALIHRLHSFKNIEKDSNQTVRWARPRANDGHFTSLQDSYLPGRFAVDGGK